MNDLGFFLIVAGAGFLIGLLISSFIASLRKPPPNIRQSAAPKPGQGEPEYPRGAVHIWQDEQKNAVMLKIGQKTLAVGEDLGPKEKKYISTLIMYLQNWVEVPEAEEQVTPAAPAAPAAPDPESQAITDTEQDETEETDPPEETSIVQQVNDLLQQKLVDSPFKDIGVILMEMPNKGMVVMVGKEQYPDVGSVPDPEIRKFIQDTVIEWE
ncbi:MAG: hypothetical protein ABFS03_04510, partial [Chloroflexota bacterium]